MHSHATVHPSSPLGTDHTVFRLGVTICKTGAGAGIGLGWASEMGGTGNTMEKAVLWAEMLASNAAVTVAHAKAEDCEPKTAGSDGKVTSTNPAPLAASTLTTRMGPVALILMMVTVTVAPAAAAGPKMSHVTVQSSPKTHVVPTAGPVTTMEGFASGIGVAVDTNVGMASNTARSTLATGEGLGEGDGDAELLGEADATGIGVRAGARMRN